VTSAQQRQAILDQPAAVKEVFRPTDHFVNGHNIVRGADCWHLFYSGAGGADNSFKRHATSDDLLTWTIQEPILHAGGPGCCDEFEVGDATIVRHEGRWIMLYTAGPKRPASRVLSGAVSGDLWHWEKLPGDGTEIFRPDLSWSAWKPVGDSQSCKDPWILPHEDRFFMVYISQTPDDQSCVALAESTDLVTWEDRGPIVQRPWQRHDLLGPGGFEVPRLFFRNGRFILMALWVSGTVYAVSDTPSRFDELRVLGPHHAATLVEHEDRWFITHAFRPFGQPSLRGELSGPHGGLCIGGLIWVDDQPVPVDLSHVV
jgi:sucrose-6-phosphate hydrolase SacC (GH32 family)